MYQIAQSDIILHGLVDRICRCLPLCHFIIVIILDLHILFHCYLIKIYFMFQRMLCIGDNDSNVALALFTNMILVFS